MLRNTLGIDQNLFNLLEPFDFNSMIELGNKTHGKYGPSYKEMFESQGIKHTSIDLNGRNDSLQLDLSMPIYVAEPADIVTNFGTSEHVKEGQEQVFRNIHNLSNRRIVHAVPKIGHYPFHGYWHFDIPFFEMLAKLNEYKIDKLFILYNKLVCCCYTKVNENMFVWSDDLPMHYNTTTRGTVIDYAED
jgi:hypothetical protein